LLGLPSIFDTSTYLFVSDIDLWTMYGQAISLVTTWYPDALTHSGDLFRALCATHKTKEVSDLTLFVFSHLFKELSEVFASVVVSSSVQESLMIESDIIQQLQHLEKLCRVIFQDCETMPSNISHEFFTKILACEKLINATPVFSGDIENIEINAYLESVYKFLIKVVDEVEMWQR